MDLANVDSLSFIAPEIVLTVTMLAVFVLDRAVRAAERIGDAVRGGLALALVAMVWVPHELDGWLFARQLVHDPFAAFFEVLFALAAMATVWMSMGSAEVRRMQQGEYYGLLLAATIGACFMAASANLLMAYLSLELLSICSYALAGFVRHDRGSSEAALKYLLYGGVASGVMLFGLSWLFGLCGSLDLVEIHAALVAGSVPPATLTIALVLILAGLGFKISMVPFHMWAPDVYAGAPVPVAAFLSVASKAAGFALLVRVLYPTMSMPAGGGAWDVLGGVEWPQLLAVLAAVTMTFGNLAALRQQRLKRMLAYSGVAHAGYLLMGLVVLDDTGLEAMLFYLIAYYFMNFGAFAVVGILHDHAGSDDLGAYRGLARRGGMLPAVAMAAFLFSLIGVPPFVGFFAKLFLFAAVVQQELYTLAVIGVLNSVISVGYYFSVLRMMFVEPPAADAGVVETTWHARTLHVVLLVGTCALGVAAGPILGFARYSLQFFSG